MIYLIQLDKEKEELIDFHKENIINGYEEAIKYLG